MPFEVLTFLIMLSSYLRLRKSLQAIQPKFISFENKADKLPLLDQQGKEHGCSNMAGKEIQVFLMTY